MVSANSVRMRDAGIKSDTLSSIDAMLEMLGAEKQADIVANEP